MKIELDVPDELVPVFIDFISSINNKFIINKIESEKPKNIPTREEVTEYVLKEDLGIDPDKFYDYYSAPDVNWCDKSGNPLNNWRSVAKSWEYNQWTNNSIRLERRKPKPEIKPIELPTSISRRA